MPLPAGKCTLVDNDSLNSKYELMKLKRLYSLDNVGYILEVNINISLRSMIYTMIIRSHQEELKF